MNPEQGSNRPRTPEICVKKTIEFRNVLVSVTHLSHQISPQAMIWRSHDMANFSPSPCVSWKSCSFGSVLSHLNCWLAACSLQLWLYCIICINIAIAASQCTVQIFTTESHRCGLAQDLSMDVHQATQPFNSPHSASAPSQSVYRGTLAQQWLDMCLNKSLWRVESTTVTTLEAAATFQSRVFNTCIISDAAEFSRNKAAEGLLGITDLHIELCERCFRLQVCFILPWKSEKLLFCHFSPSKIAIKDLEPFGLLKADKSIRQLQPKARHLFLSWPLWSHLQRSAQHFECHSVLQAPPSWFQKNTYFMLSLHVFPTTHTSVFPTYSPLRAVKDNVVKVGILSCWQGSSNLPPFLIRKKIYLHTNFHRNVVASGSWTWLHLSLYCPRPKGLEQRAFRGIWSWRALIAFGCTGLKIKRDRWRDFASGDATKRC